MDSVSILFGGALRVKLMRLFLMNPEAVFSTADIASRARAESRAVRKELPALLKAGLIGKAMTVVETPSRTKGGKSKKTRVPGFRFDPSFKEAAHLRNLLAPTNAVQSDDVVKRFRDAGKLKLVVLAGFFIGDETSRADLLVVGDQLKLPILERSLRVLESEIGKELSYAFFDTKDFLYRLDVSDKFIRDVLDYPHEKALNRMGEVL
ncbi:MAG: hypothetical protein A2408_02260 [Candidatus Yonathbacteria bacterium RIFOXYC1_FULL_52_10]|uniref:Transcriptional regulator n=1 Tax=Candidatus Yonathbacteria bacterium RIFOXYD1_FULL_52_36 TaxID=1802730 RepID=A0A1G2SJ99_9BACT|nr:MAG: hypothetical protein A2408_02260 [Candidatus Yonathbacteria bacterium RIFOXYC1_FULL_52_10]OHA85135.1 MAG: hypothetical protein A2591_04135 [Candidatus Yonathbacteria bacterium RIFOXYD1_FULL_52_36]